MLMKRMWTRLAAGSALLAMTASPAMAQNIRLSDLAIAGMSSVCVPVIERGEALDETASAEGFIEVGDEDKAALGGGADMSWWAFEFAGALLVVGRSLVEAGAPCQVLASSDFDLWHGIDDEVSNWLGKHRSGFELVRTPQAGDGPDPLWIWERVGGGSVQQLQMNVTHHKDGSTTSMLRYRLLPQRQ